MLGNVFLQTNCFSRNVLSWFTLCWICSFKTNRIPSTELNMFVWKLVWRLFNKYLLLLKNPTNMALLYSANRIWQWLKPRSCACSSETSCWEIVTKSNVSFFITSCVPNFFMSKYRRLIKSWSFGFSTKCQNCHSFLRKRM